MALILLDAGLVGLAISEPRGQNLVRDEDGRAFRAWLRSASNGSHQFAIADVTRYEVERELLRIKASRKLRLLADLLATTIPVDVTPEVWDEAARRWAMVRQTGHPTAAPEALDADALLVAVTALLANSGVRSIIATTNLGHLVALGADARAWRDIPNSV